MQHRNTKRMPRIATTIAVLVLILAWAGANGQTTERYQHRTKLHAGDGVRIIVWQDITVDRSGQLDNLNLAGDYLIDSAGNIMIPILGETKAAGYSPDALADIMQERLAIKTIRIVCLPLIRVTVLGAANRPGSYLIEPKDSLWELINEAGGPANNIDIRKIKVQRGGRIVIQNLLEGFEKAHSLDQLGVHSGDQIILPTVSKVTVDDVMRFATFGTSMLVLVLQLTQN